MAYSDSPVDVSTLPYRCCEDWEHSQYDDSDWYCVAYYPAEDRVDRVMTGTTRFASALRTNAAQPMTDEYRAPARAALVRVYASQAAEADKRRVLFPRVDELAKGTRVRFTEKHRCQRKEKAIAEVQCEKCEGAGHWQNPRVASDKRPCFGCKGAGKVSRTVRTKVRGEDGKLAWEHVEAGATGVVLGHATYGRFYRGGYQDANDAQYSTFYVLLDDGREVRVTGDKLRLDREPKTVEEYAEAFAASAEQLDFYPPFATAKTRL